MVRPLLLLIGFFCLVGILGCGFGGSNPLAFVDWEGQASWASPLLVILLLKFLMLGVGLLTVIWP